MMGKADFAATLAAWPLIARFSLAGMTLPILVGAPLFLAAGRVDWVAGWMCLGLAGVSNAVGYLYVDRRNPGLTEKRMRTGPGTKAWDKVWLVVFSVLFVAVYVVAGLDAVRFGWTAMPLSHSWPTGGMVFVAGSVLLSWSMAENPFFEKTVRIQTESGHRVIDTGPYRYVRHPGYVGVIGWLLSTPLLLGAWWAFVPAVLCIAAFIVRTMLEDRTLQAELDGYAAYAEKVRFKLIPMIW